jgi:benzoylformate decarboxylase
MLQSRTVHAARVPERAAIEKCAAALAGARSPVLVVGAGVARDGAWDQVVALAERHSAPVWVTPMSARCSFPENHPLFAGFLTAGREAIVRALNGHDVVLALGGPVNLYHVEGQGPHMPPGTELWMIGDNHVHAAWAPEGTAIVAQCDKALAMLLEGPAPVSRAMPPVKPAPALLDGSVMTDSYVLQQVSALRPAHSIIVEEAPSSRGPMHDYLPITEPDTFFTTASGGLGHGLPAAVGIAMARTEQKVIAVLGDGSAMYAIQGLHAAAQAGAAVSFVILRNNRYEALHHFGQHFGLQTLHGTQFPELDFVSIAKGHGITAEQAYDAQSLNAALARSFSANTPTLVEALIA